MEKNNMYPEQLNVKIEGEITAEINRIGTQLERLSNSIKMLENEISPVLSPNVDGSKSIGEPIATPISPLGKSLNNLSFIASEAIEKVEELISRTRV